MHMQTQFDLASLSVVKPGMDEALGVMNARLAQYFDAPQLNAPALAEARAEIHRTQGVLKMIGLDGVTVYCAEIEQVLAELPSHSGTPPPLYRTVLERALAGLTHYLDGLMHGEDNATLRLFPIYEAMQHLRGMEMSFEQDLFFPNLAVQLPESVLSIVQSGNPVANIKMARKEYQQGLMLWLRHGDVEAALSKMQLAMDSVLSCVAQNQQRGFWWVANGLLDCVKLEGLPEELGVRKLLTEIDRQMRKLTKAQPADGKLAMSEMLYLISRSQITGERAEQIKQQYALASYLLEQSAAQSADDKQTVAEIREHMQEVEDNWEQCVAGNKDACVKFVEFVEKVARKSDRLERNNPQYLSKKIDALSEYLHDPEYARLIGDDVAMALTLWRSSMSHSDTANTRFQEQARILSDQIDAAMNRRPEDTERTAELVGLYARNEQGAVTSTLASEMLANLQQVEQGLNEFFGDVTKRKELAGLQRLLVQIHGGLHILSLEQAEQLSLEVQSLVRDFDESQTAPKLPEIQAVAGAVSALHDYLEHLTHGQKHHTDGVQSALKELVGLRQGVVHPIAAAVTSAPEASEALRVPIAQGPRGEDLELLEIFLEEADEVLGIMRDNIELSQLRLDNPEPLITIRRGFHTLKGSGRMVGLSDLGEVAWAAERVMNVWVQDKKSATPALLHFVEDAVQAFFGWVADLKSQGYASIEASGLVARAQQFENVQDRGEAAPAPVVTPVAPVEIPAIAPEIVEPVSVVEPELNYEEPESVIIGDIALSPTLFNIASEEASQNVFALHRLFGEMQQAHPPLVQYDFMRAAHTLAGICRSLGFMAVVELAAALEGWLQAHIDRPGSISEQQLQMLELAIVALDEMVQSICNKQMPQPRSELVQLVSGDKDKVISDVEQALPLVELADATVEVSGAEADRVSEAELQPNAMAEAKPASAQVREQKTILHDDVDEQLLPIFLEEADELCPKIGACLRALRDVPGNEPQLQLLNRLLHTLKGSSRMTGAMRIGDIAHAMEDHLLTDDKRQPMLWDTLESEFDRINALLEELRTGKVVAAIVMETLVADDLELAERDRRSGTRTQHAAVERVPLVNMLRVRSDVVDRLVNQAGEISVARARMETELRAFKDGLLELTGSVTRLRKQLREVEIQAESQMQARISLASDSNEQFDPLEFDRFTRLQELTRFINESVHDVQTVQQSLLKNVDETNSVIFAQARLNRELQQSLMNVRMVPFGSMSERLYRLVRQTAKELNKRANLELTGTGVELDRSVLEKMTAPFEHLLRNAIAHGMEDESVRISSGKDAIGEVRLSLRQESNEVVFEFSDDGSGLDFTALRAKAIEKGLLDEADENVSEDQLAQLIFMSGVSTASEITEVAGRGIGMDVVRSEITALGGRIDVSSNAGKGTKFTIHLPLTLAVTQVLMVRAGDVTYAIPSTMVEQVRQVKPAVLAALYEERKVEWEGKIYPFNYLPGLLGYDDLALESQAHNPLLLLRSGNQRIALHVDELLGNREAVVKNIGPQLARLPGIAGATVLGDGQVVLILNPVQMTQRITVARKTRAVEPVVLRVQPMVMVVDDSLTVRKITTRLLTRAGYQVVTATDGVDALEQLTEITPDVMLLDVEMPRMDGFELTKLLRRDAKTKNLPIIMITSRTADKHRDFATQLGVNVYMGKPYQEDELLAKIAGFLAPPEAA